MIIANLFTSHNIDLEITQSKIAPSIFSLRENISKSLIISNLKKCPPLCYAEVSGSEEM